MPQSYKTTVICEADDKIEKSAFTHWLIRHFCEFFNANQFLLYDQHNIRFPVSSSNKRKCQPPSNKRIHETKKRPQSHRIETRNIKLSYLLTPHSNLAPHHKTTFNNSLHTTSFYFNEIACTYTKNKRTLIDFNPINRVSLYLSPYTHTTTHITNYNIAAVKQDKKKFQTFQRLSSLRFCANIRQAARQ